MNNKKEKVSTVRFVNGKDSPRAHLFRKVIDSLDGYEITDSEDAKYQIIFNIDDEPNTEKDTFSQLIDLAELRESYIVFDISDEDFMTPPASDFYALFSSAASFVTCSTEFIQESLYEQTGRVAYLVANPIESKEFKKPHFKSPITSAEILWYGETRDIMSIRPYLTKNKHNIKIATTGTVSYTEDRADTTIMRSNKIKDKVLSDAHIVFLPPTHHHEGEIRRQRKVEEAIMEGKIVVAPELNFDSDDLAFDCTLDSALNYLTNLKEPNEVVQNKQDKLKHKYAPEITKESLHAALDLVPADFYQQELDYYIAEDTLGT
jgi:hypothetical protein